MNAVSPLPSDHRGSALIVDDELSNRVILKALLKKMGYAVIQADNGEEAVTLFEQSRPNLVLMDIMMPIMDGYAATRKIKQLTGDRFTPVIFLTAVTDETALSRCIEVGGDDFLTKPYSHTLLAAKVHAMERIQVLHQDLHLLYNRMQRDEEIAEQVFSGAVLKGNVALDEIRSLLRPASVFSGDILLTAFSPSRDLHVLLGDFTGHGLASALGAMPASEVFRSMTAKGFSPQQILQAINSKLHSLLPVGMFLAVQFIKVGRGLDHITVFNCGMPDFFVLDGETRRVKHTIPSQDLPLGITSEISYGDNARHILIEQGDHVILATDGVTEARNTAGEYFGNDRFKQAIAASGGYAYILDNVACRLNDFCQNAPQDDDISLAEIPLIPQLLPALQTAPERQPADHLPSVKEFPADEGSDNVELHLTLRGSQLKKADPVPMLIHYLQDTLGLHSHRQPLFTILTELFVNALDHGVLGVDSQLKQSEGGIGRYFELRERRLRELTEGCIRIGARVHPLDKGGLIVIQVEDSGDGFDFDNWKRLPEDQQPFSGRGILLVESLCESLRFYAPGNRVEAVYRWLEG
ncbi:MAG: fused response regulator/phosphatase [Pseudomonadota bacterium]